MEKKFKCGDKIVFRHRTASGANTLWTLGIFSHYERDGMVLVGNLFYPFDKTEALRYDGNEWLVGTDVDTTKEVELKNGTIIVVFNVIPSNAGIALSDLHLRRFDKAGDIRIIAYPEGHWKYCIPFDKFNPEDGEAIRRNTLTVRNGKLYRAYND